jgi:hypothetical protein
MKKTIKVSLVFLILIGCATPYQEAGLDGGYSDTQKDNLKATSEQHIETSTEEKIRAVRREQDILDQAHFRPSRPFEIIFIFVLPGI